MTREEAGEKLTKYNYLVGKTVAQDTIAAIMPVPTGSKMTVEEMFTIVFNHIPHRLFDDYSDFKIAVMLNFNEFLDKGIVIWKDLDEVLALLNIDED